MTWTAFSLFVLAFAAFVFLPQHLLPQGFGIVRFGGGQRASRRTASTPQAVEKSAQALHTEERNAKGRRPPNRVRCSVRYGVFSAPCPDFRTSPPFAVSGESERGSDIVKKRLKRVLERLRRAANGRDRQPTSVRGGLQSPQRMQASSCPWAHARRAS